jgi:L-ascorbate metabolism protein UlaG (beta-lactamase superfamily)
MELWEAAKFAKEINPKLTIPIHYDSPNYPVDVNEFIKEMKNFNLRVLKMEKVLRYK